MTLIFGNNFILQKKIKYTSILLDEQINRLESFQIMIKISEDKFNKIETNWSGSTFQLKFGFKTHKSNRGYKNMFVCDIVCGDNNIIEQVDLYLYNWYEIYNQVEYSNFLNNYNGKKQISTIDFELNYIFEAFCNLVENEIKSR